MNERVRLLGAVILGSMMSSSSSPSAFAQPSFVTRRDFFVDGRAPSAVATADFDADGRLDLAVTQKGQYSAGTSVHDQLVILRGDPASPGRFLTPATTVDNLTRFDVGAVLDSNPVAVAVAALDATSTPDLICANSSDSSITVIRNPDPVLGGAILTQYATPATPQALAVGDFNADGKMDVAVACGGSPGRVAVFKGDGLGSLVQEGSSYNMTGNNATGIATGDFDQDGKLDLAVITRADRTLRFLRRKANNQGFNVIFGRQVNPEPVAIAAADVFDGAQFVGPEIFIARDHGVDGALSMVR